ncbi:MAG: helix-turn-helix transcriptional regulator [Faecalibacterium sp.]|nr:helix-turn-helix transcriptional regulator [Faecalibacterium sp.]
MELDMKERLNLVRKRKGFNQEEFGKRIGVTRSAVCNYESGTRPISDQVILAVCREFGIAESWLRYGSGTMDAPKDDDVLGKVIDDYHCNKFEGEFLKTYFQMTEAERAEFVTAMYRLIRPLMKNMEGKNPLAGYYEATYGVDSPEVQKSKEVADAEAAYEKTLDSAQNTKAASASSTTEDTACVV